MSLLIYVIIIFYQEITYCNVDSFTINIALVSFNDIMTKRWLDEMCKKSYLSKACAVHWKQIRKKHNADMHERDKS